jgi:alpha-D-xyloside xylohydrolase
VWSYTEEVYEILKNYLFMRERMRPYLTRLMEEAHEKGTPVMRPLFYDFPQDQKAWETEDAYMFGPDVLAAPVMYAEQRERSVYLPAGASWKNYWTGETLDGGQCVTVSAPLEQIPLFFRDGKEPF